MKPLVTLLTVLVVAHLTLLALAVGQGYLLHWVIPSIDFPIAVLIGLVATVATTKVVLKIVGMMMSFPALADTEASADDEDEGADEPDDEDEEDERPPSPSREFHIDWHRLAPRHRRRKRKR